MSNEGSFYVVSMMIRLAASKASVMVSPPVSPVSIQTVPA
jgi:hypothetical protein